MIELKILKSKFLIFVSLPAIFEKNPTKTTAHSLDIYQDGPDFCRSLIIINIINRLIIIEQHYVEL